MNPRDAHIALAAQLREELAGARRMLEILEEEQRALKQQDLPAMEAAAQAKLAHHGEWEAMAARRNGLLRMAGFTADRDGLTACIAWCDQAGKLDGLWQELAALLDTCRRLNRSNGLAVELCQKQVGDALAILHGGPPAGTPVYDASGTAAPRGEGRSLGSA